MIGRVLFGAEGVDGNVHNFFGDTVMVGIDTVVQVFDTVMS